MEGAAADVLTTDVEVSGRAASMEVGFSVEESEGTALTGRKPSVTLFSISENKGLEKVGRGLGSVAVTGGTEIGGTEMGGIGVSGIDVGGIDIGGIDVGGIDVGGIDVGGIDVGGIKVGEVGTCGIGVCGAEVCGAETCVVLEGPSSLSFPTPSIASSSCSSPSFRALHSKVRFAASSSSRRFVALLYSFLSTKSSPFRATAMAGQL